MKKYISLFMLCLFAFSCGTDKNKELLEGLFIKEIPPTITTNKVSDIGVNNVAVWGIISNRGSSRTLRYGVCLHTQPNPTTENIKFEQVLEANNNLTDFLFLFRDLQANTTYYVRAYAITEQKVTVYGQGLEFKTLPPLTVTTGAVSNITVITASIVGQITNLGGGVASEHGHCIGTAPNPTLNDTRNNLGGRNNLNAFTSTFDNLIPSTTYHVRAYARNASGFVAYGDNVQFTTPADRIPVVGTPLIKDITANNAGATATLIDAGTRKVTSFGFCWSETNKEPVINKDATSSGQAALAQGQGFSTQLSNLKMGTTYYIRSYAESLAGIGYSTVTEFTTPRVIFPIVSTNPIINITNVSAELRGNLSLLGTPAATEYGFVTSTSNPIPTISDRVINIGRPTSIGAFSFANTNLVANTTFYVRAYARSEGGVAYGEVQIFKTLAFAPPTLSTLTPTNISGISASLNGRILSFGNTAITEYGFIYSPNNSSPTVEDGQRITVGSNFSVTLFNLIINTTYYARAYVLVANIGIVYGNVVSFTTSGGSLPAIGDLKYALLSNSSLETTASIKNLGVPTANEVGFVWSLTNNTPTINDGKFGIATPASLGSFNGILNNPPQNAEYYIRAYITNALGTSYSEVVTVKLLAGTWFKRAAFPDYSLLNGFVSAVGTPNNKGYVLCSDKDGNSYLWEYDLPTNQWKQLGITPFKRYGWNPELSYNVSYRNIYYLVANQLWEYSIASNQWKRKPDFPGTQRGNMFTFNDDRYLITGMGGVNNQSFKDVWVFDIFQNMWAARKDFPSAARDLGSSFNFGSTGYIVGGFTTSNQYKEIWTYNMLSDSWTKKDNYPGFETYRFGVANIGTNKAYMISGSETWEYNLNSNTWTQKATFIGTSRFQDIIMIISGRVFFGLGKKGTSIYGDFWEFSPQ